MISMPRVLVLSLCAAMVVAASPADARRLGGARSVGAGVSGSVHAAEAATTTISYSPRIEAPVAARAATAGAVPVKTESAFARTVTGADAKNAVVTGVAAAAARASLRNAQADAQDGSGPAGSQTVSSGGFQTVSAPASYQLPSHSSAQSPAQSPASHTPPHAKYHPEGQPSKDPQLDRERAAEAMAVRMFDQSAEKAVELMEKPKTAAEIARDKKLAEEKAAAARIEKERQMKLAREASCQIEPVMSDKAIANCQKVFREPS